jgi:predicted lipid-binding transport protein (Tim44 family)
MSDFAFADIIVLGMIAVFIALRLRNTLGKQIGFDPREQRDTRDALRRSMQAEAAKTAEGLLAGETPATDAGIEAMPEGVLRTALEALRSQEPSFSTTNFLDGAKGAFEWIFNAFHKGDRAVLKPLLGADVFAEFDAAISAREIANHQSKATLVAITEATITDAQIEKRTARITVRFVSEQVVMTVDADGTTLEGDASHVVTVDDEWTFTREIGARTPNWTVSDT